MVERIRQSVIVFEGEAGFFDDLTLIALLRDDVTEKKKIPEGSNAEEAASGDKNGPGNSLDRSEVRLEITASLEELGKIKEEFFWKIEMNEDRKKEIYLVLEEWFADIVSYSGATKVDIEMSTFGNEFTAIFIDNGALFDIEHYVPKEKEFEDFDLGGMGIGLIKSITKRLSWERVGECNKVTMVFAMEQE